ncbi:hypothetical protein BT69DRAFT_1338817 [Atractiella rhizophila]|nr:hypothetical protein BT69DRAFT_1338817 [Atractiella rhizophila]
MNPTEWRADPVGSTCFVFGLFLLLFGLYSRVIKNAYLSEPLLSTLFGIALGPRILGAVNLVPEQWMDEEGGEAEEARETLKWFCRIVIGIQVLFAASTLPSRWLLEGKNVKSLIVLLIPVMTVSWLVTGALVKLCLPSTRMSEALMIGACIAPTDPVLANSVVKGIFAEQHVPQYIRELLVAESGINDGFGSPFLFIPLFAVLNNYEAGKTARDFFLYTAFWDTFWGSFLGGMIGYAARKGLKIARRKETIDRESMLVFSVALAFFTIGIANIFKTNELLACFFAGTALNWTDKISTPTSQKEWNFFFDTSVFLLLGSILPFSTWADPNFLPLGRLVLLGVLILILRRLPVVLFLQNHVPLIKARKEATFVGFFGPIGVGALYYALVATEELPHDYTSRSRIIPVVTFVVFCSIIVHGTSAPLIMRQSRPLFYSIFLTFGSQVARNLPALALQKATPTDVAEATERDPLLRHSSTHQRISQAAATSAEDLDEDEELDEDRKAGVAYPAMGGDENLHHAKSKRGSSGRRDSTRSPARSTSRIRQSLLAPPDGNPV